MIIASILIAFGLIIAVIFLEISGAKHEGKSLFAAHPKVLGGSILIIMLLVFIGAGGLGVINVPMIPITESMAAVVLFVGVMLVSIWVIIKEGGKKPK